MPGDVGPGGLGRLRGDLRSCQVTWGLAVLPGYGGSGSYQVTWGLEVLPGCVWPGGLARLRGVGLLPGAERELGARDGG